VAGNQIAKPTTNERKNMGLTIHYSLKARGSYARTRKLIHAPHQTAKDLPTKELGQIVNLCGDQCDFNKFPLPNSRINFLMPRSSQERPY
jgi:hypothetical protein